jgi:hypothetical protein
MTLRVLLMCILEVPCRHPRLGGAGKSQKEYVARRIDVERLDTALGLSIGDQE